MVDTESLPRFRPPCGVIPYSCLSDGLHWTKNTVQGRACCCLCLLGSFVYEGAVLLI